MRRLRRLLVVPLPFVIAFDVMVWEAAPTLLILALTLGLVHQFEAEEVVRAWSRRPSVRLLKTRRLTVWLLLTALVGVTVAFAGMWSATLAWGLVVQTGVVASLRQSTADKLLTLATLLLAVLLPFGLESEVAVILGLATLVACMAALAMGTMFRTNEEKVEHGRQLVAAQERSRMAADLHDLVAHEVTGIAVLAQAAGSLVVDENVADVFDQIETSARNALSQIRELVRPESDAAATIVGQPLDAIEKLVERFALMSDTDVSFGLPETVPSEAHAAVFHRALAEFLTNIRRHAEPTLVEIELEDVPGGHRLTVVNDGLEQGGVGQGGGSGLDRIRERASLLGGSFSAGPMSDGCWKAVLELPEEDR